MTAAPHRVVLGGGLAGLGLAVHLLDRMPAARITVIEPRREYVDDRSWCWWDTEPHPFYGAVAERWPRWRVRAAGGTAEAGGRYRYCRVPALALYRLAEARIAAAPNARLCRGVTASDIGGADGRLAVETDAGRLRADTVFDGRPPGKLDTGRHPLLWQQFAGRRVRLGAAPFDPSAVELMDFRVPQGDGLHFLYVLPSGREEALVEATWFVPSPLPAEAVEARLDAEIARLAGGGSVEILGREAGRLPMTAAPPPPPPPAVPGVVPIGMRAGALRPATGYGFMAIQRHSAAIADRLARGRAPAAAVHGRGTMVLDDIFLRFLARRPERAPDLFLRLFRRCPADRLVRFLSEAGSAADVLAAVAALPARPMLREAAESLHARIRRPAAA
jgi:lycopene beta-cyclase